MNKPEAEQIAHAVAMIRPDWLVSSLATALGNLPAHLRGRPARDVHLAALWLAYDPQQRTPRLLREDGPWWNLGSLAGPGTQRASTTNIATRCAHGLGGTECDECYPATRQLGGNGVLPTAEQRAAIRAAIDASKTTTTGRTTP